MPDLDTRPRCYVAVYADPDLPGHVTVEGGTFGNRNMPPVMEAGDMVLVYCTGSYQRYAKASPGIAMVTGVDHEQKRYWYEFLPFAEPVPLDFIRLCMQGQDAWRFANIRYDWLFQVSRESFSAVMQGARLGKAAPGPRTLL
ncbi:MAG: hypothetical protein WD645_03580 [Dehalococcoidia bacterium]